MEESLDLITTQYESVLGHNYESKQDQLLQ